MNSFLYKVATDLKDRIGKDLADVAVVFPNKRAALFFNKYLVKDEDGPVWAPKYMTISELFGSIRPEIVIPDSMELVCRLYSCYCRVLKDRVKENETIDSLDYFYQWGETIISDFDDVDKNMADARKLFTNINDWHQLESSDFIDEEQEENIKKFFSGFSVENMSILRQRFLEMWNNLYDIYTLFNEELAKENMSYEGALYRSIIEHFDIDQLPCSKYVFVGFNVLDTVETKLFDILRDADKALFYWDYSPKYMDGNEAGIFLKKNLERYPNSLPDSNEENSTEKEVVIISSKTENAQAQYARKWIEDNMTEDEAETAVILCDEHQLQPVLRSIPNDVKCINVTMGYPLSETPAMSLVQAIINMQAGYDKGKDAFTCNSTIQLLKHPYMSILSPNTKYILRRITENNIFYPTQQVLSEVEGEEDQMLKYVFTRQTDNLIFCNYLSEIVKTVAQNYKSISASETETSDEIKAERKLYEQLYGESLFRIYTTIIRFSNLIESGLLKVEREMLVRLIGRVLQGITIPFHGEPAIGLQMMGMLETRNLDFRNILMLGVNEGTLPKASEIPSFIPPTIRQGFGMTTIDRRIAVFAYYFYRLLQRSEKIYYMYNDETTNGQKGEMSRFLLQLIADTDISVRTMTITSKININPGNRISVPKSEETLKVLKNRFKYTGESQNTETAWIKKWIDNHGTKPVRTEGNSFQNRYILSPSAINTYIDCSIKFYFKYIAGLKIKEDITVDIDSAMFGTIFHNTAEEIYNRLTAKGNTILASDLTALLEYQHADESTTAGSEKLFKIEPIVDFYFRKEFFRQKELSSIQTCLEMTDKKIVCPEVTYNGIHAINKEVIVRLILKLIQIDSQHDSFNYLGSEINVSRTEKINPGNGEEFMINIGGNIDRLDFIGDNTIRIIDYKTGTKEHKTAQLAEIFIPDKERSGYHLQTFMYSSILCDIIENKAEVKPVLLYIQKQESGKQPELKIGKDTIESFLVYKEDMDKMLREKLNEMFSVNGSYEQTEVTENCQYCDFKQLCKR